MSNSDELLLEKILSGQDKFLDKLDDIEGSIAESREEIVEAKTILHEVIKPKLTEHEEKLKDHEEKIDVCAEKHKSIDNAVSFAKWGGATVGVGGFVAALKWAKDLFH